MRSRLSLLVAFAAAFSACSRTELNPTRMTSGAGAEQGGSLPNGGGGAAAGGGASGSGGGLAGSGGGGASGVAGMGGGGAPDCEDFEPCTDDVAEQGVCHHRPSKDGTACDDLNVCTQGDRCLAGHCEGGIPVTGSPEVLSVSTPTFQGQGLGVGKDRFLFRSSSPGTLTLARVVGEVFESLDKVNASINSAFWIADDLLAYKDGSGGGLIDLSGDKIRLRGHFATGVQPSHFALTTDRLWVCLANSSLIELELVDLDTLDQIGGELAIPGGCRALAPSGDGKQVYVSTQTDTLMVVPQAGGAATVAGALAVPSHSVHARHGYITLSSATAAVVLRESDRAEVARLTAAVSNARVTSRGLEVIDYVARPGTTDVVFSVYQIDEGAAEPLKLRGSQVLKTLAGSVAAQPTVWASCDDALMDEPHVYRLSEPPPFLSEIRDPGLAWPGWLRVEGTTIYLRDSLRAVRVDVQDPAHPRAVFGGPFPKPLEGSSLEIPKQGELALFGDPSANERNARTRMLRGLADVHLRSFDADQRPIEGPSLALGAEPGDTWITRRKLYQLQRGSAAPVTSFRLMGWDADALASSPLAGLVLDTAFNAPSGYELNALARVHDDDATAFNVARIGSAAPVSSVYWAGLTMEQRSAGPLALDLHVWDLAASGDRVIVMGFAPNGAGRLDVTFVSAERRGTALVEVNRTSWPTPIDDEATLRGSYEAQQLLGFDGQVAYAQLAFGTIAAPGPAVVGVLFGSSITEPVAYPLQTDEALWSFSMSDVGLVYSRPNALYIARPLCQ